jgi:hypothetical protein
MSKKQSLEADVMPPIPPKNETGPSGADPTACNDSGQVDNKYTQQQCSCDSVSVLPVGYRYTNKYLEFEREGKDPILVCDGSFRVVAWYGTAKLGHAAKSSSSNF